MSLLSVILSVSEESPQETLRAKALRVTKKGHSEPPFCHSEARSAEESPPFFYNRNEFLRFAQDSV